MDEATATGEGVRQTGVWMLAQVGPQNCDRLPKTEGNECPHIA